MVNNLRFQWGRDLEVAGANSPAPYVSLSNITNYGEFYALPRTAEPDEHRTQIADTVSKVYGRHSFKTGFDFNVIHEVMINLFQGTGRYTYSGTAQQAFTNWALDTFGINAGRRPDRQALQHLHPGERPDHARRQGRFLRQRRLGILRR